jgi:geranylgeranyl pyrophosphate synthase
LEAQLGSIESADDVERGAEMVDKLNGRSGALQLADEHLQAATAALDRADLQAIPRRQLGAIAQFVTERNR